jgi:protein involved in polysaccharide export with SLBB domain
VGDRIYLRVLEDTALTDTFAVRAGKMLELPLMPEIPLTGVLRAELQPYLEGKIAQYVRNPTVEVTPLLRVAILGGVGSPGYYNLPADILLSDAVMLAGGPSGSMKLDESKVERLGVEIYDADAVQQALNQGVTLDRLSLVGGDVVEIGEDKLGRTESLLRTIGLLLAIPLSIAAVASLFD